LGASAQIAHAINSVVLAELHEGRIGRASRHDVEELLAIPMAVVTSRVGLGSAMRAHSYLLIPEETQSPAVLRRAWLHARRVV
jgi:hypothetical protein